MRVMRIVYIRTCIIKIHVHRKYIMYTLPWQSADVSCLRRTENVEIVFNKKKKIYIYIAPVSTAAEPF